MVAPKAASIPPATSLQRLDDERARGLPPASCGSLEANHISRCKCMEVGGSRLGFTTAHHHRVLQGQLAIEGCSCRSIATAKEPFQAHC